MAKLNRGTYTFLGYLKRIISGSSFSLGETGPSDIFGPSEYAYLHDIEDEREEYSGVLDFFRGALQPFQDMWKDLKDTFKPFKGSYQVERDALQPIRGLGNIAAFILTIVGAPLAFIFNTIRYACMKEYDFKENMKFNLGRTGAWMLNSLITAIRGVTQIATTPLTWFLRIPLRAIITAVVGKPKIEDSKRIKKLVKKGFDELRKNDFSSAKKVDVVTRVLHIKFEKARYRSQATLIDVEKEDGNYLDRLRTSTGHYYDTEAWSGDGYIPCKLSRGKLLQAQRYLRLFAPEIEPESTTATESNKKEISANRGTKI